MGSDNESKSLLGGTKSAGLLQVKASAEAPRQLRFRICTATILHDT